MTVRPRSSASRARAAWAWPFSTHAGSHSSHVETPAVTRAKAAELNLYDAAKLIDQPFLAITGRNDRLIPWEQTERQAAEAPNGEFVLYDDGNHVVNNIPYAYRPLTADWLAEKLG